MQVDNAQILTETIRTLEASNAKMQKDFADTNKANKRLMIEYGKIKNESTKNQNRVKKLERDLRTKHFASSRIDLKPPQKPNGYKMFPKPYTPKHTIRVSQTSHVPIICLDDDEEEA